MNILFSNSSLVIIDYLQDLNIKVLESRLKQGKISFASEIRLKKYLGLEPGSVSPFGLIHDKEKNVHIFIDENLQKAQRLSFHPNVNTASIIISKPDFLKFMDNLGNSYEFIKLYD
jgi:Ala-tRNA(Pro) deacylase